jgi:large subunit ribosomal protein L15
VINLDTLDKYFNAGETVTQDTLSGKGIIKRSADAIKILSRGEISKPLLVKANKFSKKAIERILGAGGTAEVI